MRPQISGYSLCMMMMMTPRAPWHSEIISTAPTVADNWLIIIESPILITTTTIACTPAPPRQIMSGLQNQNFQTTRALSALYYESDRSPSTDMKLWSCGEPQLRRPIIAKCMSTSSHNTCDGIRLFEIELYEPPNVKLCGGGGKWHFLRGLATVHPLLHPPTDAKPSLRNT